MWRCKLKEGRPVLKAIVASPVRSADGLLAVTARVPQHHFPTENHSNLTGCKPGLGVRNLLGKNVVCSSLPLTTTKWVFRALTHNLYKLIRTPCDLPSRTQVWLLLIREGGGLLYRTGGQWEGLLKRGPALCSPTGDTCVSALSKSDFGFHTFQFKKDLLNVSKNPTDSSLWCSNKGTIVSACATLIVGMSSLMSFSWAE